MTPKTGVASARKKHDTSYKWSYYFVHTLKLE